MSGLNHARRFNTVFQCRVEYKSNREDTGHQERILRGSITGKQLVVVSSKIRIQFRLGEPMLEWDMRTQRQVFEFGPDLGPGDVNPDHNWTRSVVVWAFQI